MITAIDKAGIGLERMRVLKTIHGHLYRHERSYFLAAYRLARKMYPDLTAEEWRQITNGEPPEMDPGETPTVERTCECESCTDEQCQGDCVSCDDHSCRSCNCGPDDIRPCCGFCGNCHNFHEEDHDRPEVCDQDYCHECNHSCDG